MTMMKEYLFVSVCLVLYVCNINVPDKLIYFTHLLRHLLPIPTIFYTSIHYETFFHSLVHCFFFILPLIFSVSLYLSSIPRTFRVFALCLSVVYNDYSLLDVKREKTTNVMITWKYLLSFFSKPPWYSKIILNYTSNTSAFVFVFLLLVMCELE